MSTLNQKKSLPLTLERSEGEGTLKHPVQNSDEFGYSGIQSAFPLTTTPLPPFGKGEGVRGLFE